MEQKRQSIRQKMQRIVLIISIAGLLLTSTVGVFSMLRIKGDSEAALISQMNQNLLRVVQDKASLADSELEKYAGYILDFSAGHRQHRQYDYNHLHRHRERIPDQL